jgi:hypothetical protein
VPQLHRHDEEEHGEEAVADPVPDGEVECAPAEVGVLEVEQRGAGGRVREEEAEGGGAEQESGGGALGADEAHGGPFSRVSACGG